MRPAARVGDMHVCPMNSAYVEAKVVRLIPHVGGLIITGALTVEIAGAPAARVGDLAVCMHSTPDVISTGSTTVLIEGNPAARLGDRTAHAGTITAGAPTVFIGG